MRMGLRFPLHQRPFDFQQQPLLNVPKQGQLSEEPENKEFKIGKDIIRL